MGRVCCLAGMPRPLSPGTSVCSEVRVLGRPPPPVTVSNTEVLDASGLLLFSLHSARNFSSLSSSSPGLPLWEKRLLCVLNMSLKGLFPFLNPNPRILGFFSPAAEAGSSSTARVRAGRREEEGGSMTSADHCHCLNSPPPGSLERQSSHFWDSSLWAVPSVTPPPLCFLLLTLSFFQGEVWHLL